MNRLPILLASALLTLTACGGSDSSPVISEDQQVLNMLSNSNMLQGGIVRPADNELPLTVALEDDSEILRQTLGTLEGIAFEAGYPLTVVSNSDKPQLLIAHGANTCNGVGSRSEISPWAMVFEVGSIEGCGAFSAVSMSYRFLGLKRGGAEGLDFFKRIDKRNVIADRAIATLYNNPPGTPLDALDLH